MAEELREKAEPRMAPIFSVLVTGWMMALLVKVRNIRIRAGFDRKGVEAMTSFYMG